MGLKVAQLSIQVTADTGPVAASLQALPALFQNAAQAAQSAGGQETAANAAVLESLSSIRTAIAANSLETQRSGALMVQSLGQVGSATNTASQASQSFGNLGRSSLVLMNGAAMQLGQGMGPVVQGINLAAGSIMVLGSNASTSTRLLTGLTAGLVTLAAAGVKAGSELTGASGQLSQAIQQNNADIGSYGAATDAMVAKGQKYATSQDVVMKSLAQLAPVTKDGATAQALLQGAFDVSAFKGKSLQTALDGIIRATEGNSRSLKSLGVDITGLVANPAGALDSAMQKLAVDEGKVTDAQSALQQATQRYNDSLAEQALKTDQIAKAQENLANVQQNLAYTQQRIALENAAPKVTATATATDALATAEQHLQDVRDKAGAEAAAPQIDKVAKATDQLTLAQLRLNDANASQKSASTQTPAELAALAAASDRVLASQMALAQAQGSNILGAQNSLRAAVDAQRKALDEQAAKQEAALKGTTSQVAAQIAVKDATQALRDAQTEQTNQAAGNTTKQIDNAIALRDATDAVKDAQQKLTDAKAKDSSTEALRQLANEKALFDATKQVESAEDAVKQARNDQQIQILKQRDAYLAVKNAQEAVNDAVGAQAAQQQKVNDLQGAEQHNIDIIQKALEVAAGQADKHADTTLGHLKSFGTELKNLWQDMNTGAAGTVLHLAEGVGGLAAQVLLYRNIAKRLGGPAAGGEGGLAGEAGAAADGVAGIGAEGVVAAEEVGGVVAFATGLGEVAVGLAAIGITAKVAYDHWDTIKSGWATIGNGIVDKVHEVGHSFTDLFGDDKWNDYKTKAAAAGKGVIKSLDDGMADQAKVYPDVLGSLGRALAGQSYDAAQPGGDAYSSGQNVVAGLWNGMAHDADTYLFKNTSALGKNVITAFRNSVGSQSPSKEFHFIGQDIVQGLVNGIGASAPAAIDSVKKMALDMTKQKFSLPGLQQQDLSGLPQFAAGSPGAVHLYNTYLTVQGSVSTERDLVQRVTDGMIALGHGQGGNLGGGFFS